MWCASKIHKSVSIKTCDVALLPASIIESFFPLFISPKSPDNKKTKVFQLFIERRRKFFFFFISFMLVWNVWLWENKASENKDDEAAAGELNYVFICISNLSEISLLKLKICFRFPFEVDT
jgi:hypothetical protein